MRTTKWIAAALFAIGLTATAVMAADGEPGKAGKYQSNMVNASADCVSSSETTGGALPFPACPAVDGPICTFGAKGQAKVQAKAKDDVSLALKIKGLENCPDGTVLQATASFKSTTNNCTVSSRCTTTSIPNYAIPGATCTVDGGGCSIKTTLNTLIPGLIVPGENTAIELGTIGVSAGTVAVAVAGILVP